MNFLIEAWIKKEIDSFEITNVGKDFPPQGVEIHIFKTIGNERYELCQIITKEDLIYWGDIEGQIKSCIRKMLETFKIKTKG